MCCLPQAALEAVTATHQLNAAVDALSHCVRPLLLAGRLAPLGRDADVQEVNPKPLTLY